MVATFVILVKDHGLDSLLILPTPEGWKAELAWLVDPQRILYPQSGHMPTTDQGKSARQGTNQPLSYASASVPGEPFTPPPSNLANQCDPSPNASVNQYKYTTFRI